KKCNVLMRATIRPSWQYSGQLKQATAKAASSIVNTYHRLAAKGLLHHYLALVTLLATSFPPRTLCTLCGVAHPQIG
ncbi:MAG TPA: hypothetical protein VEL31_30280, partial [Ktedonobacteraceae bacterium]|nr:hypothetical protein [Ktedonobacteraceae bacterium]